MVDKFKKKLALWKRKCLSFAGRLPLIRSVLSSLPVYFLSLFKMLVGIARSIDKIQSNFLWGGTELRRKIHLVSWKEACLSKLQRKLGVKNLRKVNDFLLIKWWWRYGREENASWKQVLCSKYGGIGGRWSPFPVDSDVMSILWQDVLSMKFTNPALSELYFNDVKIVVGNGKRIQFWVDRWFNNQSLSEVFPRLFLLSTENGCSLLYFFHKKGEGRDWKLALRRPLLAWEEEVVSKLNDLLYNAPTLNAEVEESCSWLACSSRSFIVASVWQKMESSKGPEKSITRSIWRTIAHPKVQFLSWLAWRGRIKSSDWLLKIGVLNPNASTLCVFCKFEVETMNHVLLYCHLIWRVWSDIVKWWNLFWVIPGSMDEFLQWWSDIRYKVQMNKIWKVVPLAMLWFVWKLKNECVFNEAKPDFADFTELVKVKAALWAKSNLKELKYSVHDIVYNLKQVCFCV